MSEVIFYKLGCLSVHKMDCGSMVLSFMQGRHSELPVSYILKESEIYDPRLDDYESKLRRIASKLSANQKQEKKRRLIPAVCNLFSVDPVKGFNLSSYQNLSEIDA